MQLTVICNYQHSHSHVGAAIHTANYDTARQRMYFRKPLGEETVTVDLNKLCVLVAIL